MNSTTAAEKFNKRRAKDQRFSKNKAIKKTFINYKNFLVNLLNEIAKKGKIKAKAESLNGGSYSVVLKKKGSIILSIVCSVVENKDSYNPSLDLEGPKGEKISIKDFRPEVLREKIGNFASVVIL